MTVERALGFADQLHPRERLVRWQECGPHRLADLPRTDDGSVYCLHCWSVWDAHGVIVHEPKETHPN
jgi:hypothetical protein